MLARQKGANLEKRAKSHALFCDPFTSIKKQVGGIFEGINFLLKNESLLYKCLES